MYIFSNKFFVYHVLHFYSQGFSDCPQVFLINKFRDSIICYKSITSFSLVYHNDKWMQSCFS